LVEHIESLGIPRCIGQFESSAGAIDRSILIDWNPILPLKLWKGQGGLEFEFAIDRRGDSTVVGQFPNLDVSERNQVAVVLQANIAFASFAKARELRELALGYQFVPAFITELELVINNPIHGDFTTPRGDS